MYYTYILYSKNYNKHYYGSTINLLKRLQEHNKGKSNFTKAFIPWEVIYYEEYDTRSEAYKRELFFKSSEGKKWLKENNKI